MSLPRYLAIKRLAFEQTATWGDYAVEALGAGVYFGKRVYDVLDAAVVSGKTTRPLHVAWCFMSARWAINELRCHKCRGLDGMDRIEASLYIGLRELSEGRYEPDFRIVRVPRYFTNKLSEINVERETRDRHDVELAKRISTFRNKVYVSRCFPAHLRLLIFERDRYCCQNCLRQRDALAAYGLTLEVDHVLAFVDGGKTTYANGVTLCSECNRAKHTAKPYFQALANLERGVGRRPK